MTSEQYDNIKSELSVCYREIFKNKIELLNEASDKDRIETSGNIMNQLEDAFANGKINESHYNLLTKRLSNNGHS